MMTTCQYKNNIIKIILFVFTIELLFVVSHAQQPTTGKGTSFSRRFGIHFNNNFLSTLQLPIKYKDVKAKRDSHGLKQPFELTNIQRRVLGSLFKFKNVVGAMVSTHRHLKSRHINATQAKASSTPNMEISRDVNVHFYVDYSSPKTHPPKHN